MITTLSLKIKLSKHFSPVKKMLDMKLVGLASGSCKVCVCVCLCVSVCVCVCVYSYFWTEQVCCVCVGTHRKEAEMYPLLYIGTDLSVSAGSDLKSRISVGPGDHEESVCVPFLGSR